MYSVSVEKILAKLKIDLGDIISVESAEGKFEGMLMPRTGESDILVLKLNSGYNIGLSSKAAKINLVEKAQKTKPEAGSLKQETGSQKQGSGHETENTKLETRNDLLFPRPETLNPKQSPGDIAILGCGGTIASKIEYKTGAVFPAISPEEMKAAFPKLESLAKIRTKKLFTLLSEDMHPEHWKIMAKAVEEEIKHGAEGVVLMHGTDTMTYSSAAMSFMIQNLPVPVIFVGSQRSSDRPSSDNEINLMNAVFAAQQDFAEVAVCMHASTNDDFCSLHRGTRVRKMHTSARDAFKSINSLPIARLDYAKNLFDIAHSSYRKREKKSAIVETRFNDNVALIYLHPGIKPKFVSKLSDYDGVVLIGTGLGHVSTNPFGDKNAIPIIKEVKSLVDSDIPVVMAPQAIFGRLNMHVYTAGRMLMEAGVIGDGCDWTPETAFVKLGWVLGHTKKMEKVKEEMLTNMVGELSERSLVAD